MRPQNVKAITAFPQVPAWLEYILLMLLCLKGVTELLIKTVACTRFGKGTRNVKGLWAISSSSPSPAIYSIPGFPCDTSSLKKKEKRKNPTHVPHPDSFWGDAWERLLLWSESLLHFIGMEAAAGTPTHAHWIRCWCYANIPQKDV